MLDENYLNIGLTIELFPIITALIVFSETIRVFLAVASIINYIYSFENSVREDAFKSELSICKFKVLLDIDAFRVFAGKSMT